MASWTDDLTEEERQMLEAGTLFQPALGGRTIEQTVADREAQHPELGPWSPLQDQPEIQPERAGRAPDEDLLPSFSPPPRPFEPEQIAQPPRPMPGVAETAPVAQPEQQPAEEPTGDLEVVEETREPVLGGGPGTVEPKPPDPVLARMGLPPEEHVAASRILDFQPQSPAGVPLRMPAPEAAQEPAVGRRTGPTEGPMSRLERELASAQNRGTILSAIGLAGRGLNQAFGRPEYDEGLRAAVELGEKPVRDVLARHEARQGEERLAQQGRLAEQQLAGQQAETAARRQSEEARLGMDRERLTETTRHNQAVEQNWNENREVRAQYNQQRIEIARRNADTARQRADQAARRHGANSGAARAARQDAEEAENIWQRIYEDASHTGEALSPEETARVAAISRSTGGARSVGAVRTQGGARRIGNQQQTQNARWLAQRLGAENYDEIMVALPEARSAIDNASDGEVLQAVASLATGVVPDTSTLIGGSIEAVNQPLRHSAFGATLTGNELAAFRRYSGQRLADAGQARRALKAYFDRVERRMNAIANRLAAAVPDAPTTAGTAPTPAVQGGNVRARRMASGASVPMTDEQWARIPAHLRGE